MFFVWHGRRREKTHTASSVIPIRCDPTACIPCGSPPAHRMLFRVAAVIHVGRLPALLMYAKTAKEATKTPCLTQEEPRHLHESRLERNGILINHRLQKPPIGGRKSLSFPFSRRICMNQCEKQTLSTVYPQSNPPTGDKCPSRPGKTA